MSDETRDLVRWAIGLAEDRARCLSCGCSGPPVFGHRRHYCPLCGADWRDRHIEELLRRIKAR